MNVFESCRTGFFIVGFYRGNSMFRVEGVSVCPRSALSSYSTNSGFIIFICTYLTVGLLRVDKKTMFGLLQDDDELEKFNFYLEDKSYISGYEPSTLDCGASDMIKTPSVLCRFSHIARWHRHVSSFPSNVLVSSQEPFSKYFHVQKVRRFIKVNRRLAMHGF